MANLSKAHLTYRSYSCSAAYYALDMSSAAVLILFQLPEGLQSMLPRTLATVPAHRTSAKRVEITLRVREPTRQRGACPSSTEFHPVLLRAAFTLARLIPIRMDWKSMLRLLGHISEPARNLTSVGTIVEPVVTYVSQSSTRRSNKKETPASFAFS